MTPVCDACAHEAGKAVCFHPESYRGASLVYAPAPPGHYNDDEWYSCHRMRDQGQPCGPEGRLFQPFPPAFPRLRAWVRKMLEAIP